jgi:hypothetical protein
MKIRPLSRLEKIRSTLLQDVVSKTISSDKSKKEVLEDISDVIEDSLRKYDGMEFNGKNWGLIMKLVVLDDLLLIEREIANNGR